jgi:hypothetical protein
MEHNIVVGGIVGLALASSIFVLNSINFSKVQKTGLLICIIFPPAQWLGILLVMAYNSNRDNNTIERKTEKKLNSSISNLIELKEKRIITEDEYKTKVEKIENEKSEQFLKNSKEYKQLKSLFDAEVLTKSEFESKIQLLQNSIYQASIQIETVFWETINNQILKIVIEQNQTIGADVFINETIAPDGIYYCKFGRQKLVILKGKIIEEYFIEKVKGIIIEMTDEYFPNKGDKVFLANGEKAPNGKYSMGFMVSKLIVEDGVIVRYE